MKIVAVGELLWDLLPSGRQLGGAPANFAVHARELGAEVVLISRVGDDDLGREATAALRERGLPTDAVQVDASAATGTVQVAVAADGQPAYRIVENVAWDEIEADGPASTAASTADAICFGTLAQRTRASCEAIRTLLQAVKPGCLRVFDANLRQHYWTAATIRESLVRADAVKLNEEEWPAVAEAVGLTGNVRNFAEGLATKYRLRLVALTRGERGSLLHAGGAWDEHPGLKVAVRNSVGAGDAFTAVAVTGFLAGYSLARINERANAVAAYVCGRRGATPALTTALVAC